MLGLGALELSRRPGFGRNERRERGGRDERGGPGERDGRDNGADATLAEVSEPIARGITRAVPRGSTRATADEAAGLFEAYGERIRRYVAFRVRSSEDAEDLTADVFRRVLSAPVPIEEGARPAWLFRVAHNAIVDHYRRRRFLAPLANILDRPDDAPTLPERAIRDEETRRVDTALRTLVGRQRAAIYLRFYEDLEYADIASVMGVPAATARSLVHRGLKKLAGELGSADR
jgi:RNA polymerase sigma-70 factor (ECF subfamily)